VAGISSAGAPAGNPRHLWLTSVKVRKGEDTTKNQRKYKSKEGKVKKI
jgi:hypothetical protein